MELHVGKANIIAKDLQDGLAEPGVLVHQSVLVRCWSVEQWSEWNPTDAWQPQNILEHK